MTERPAYAADALGIGIATGVYGISFGVLAVAAGLSAAQACAMSLLVFTGGSQFAAVGVIAAGGAAATAVANALLLAVRNARGAFWLTGAAVFVCWNAGTLAGALAGSGLGDPAKYGLDAMFPAAFLALLAPQLRQPGAPAAALAGALIAVVLLPLTPAGVPVIAASLGVLAGLRRRA